MRFVNLLVLGLFMTGFLCVSCERGGESLVYTTQDGTEDTGEYTDDQGVGDSGTISNSDTDTGEYVGSSDSGTGEETDGAGNTDADTDSNTYEDKDGDGWYSEFDCDDENPQVYPGSEEQLGNLIDDDCDGQTDEVLETDSEEVCATESYESKLEKKTSDIIFILDNSSSMNLEASWVQENMNGFSEQIAASGVDYKVVVISSYPGNGNGICIDAPLGSGGCPNKDTNLPKFQHVNQEVASTNGLSLLLSTYPFWMGMMRPNSAKHIVIVSDDNSSLPAFLFQIGLIGLGSGFSDYKFHGIFSYTLCKSAWEVGSVYRTLVQRTGGVSGDLCLQNFAPVFDKLATAVVEESKISCKIPMPDAPSGKKINLDEVSVEVVPSPGSPAQELKHVAGSGKCGSGGWYYDNNTNPTKIVLCPLTCDWAQGFTDAELTVDSGCLALVV